MTAYFFVFLAAAASAGATVLLKLSATNAPLAWDVSFLSSRYLYLGAAFAAYGFGFVCYWLALRRLPISVGYPLMGGVTILLVACCDHFLLGQTVPLTRMAGMVLITIGMALAVA